MILYLHGFRSSPAAWKSRCLKEALNRRGKGSAFLCPALSPVPDLALAQADDLIRTSPRPVTLVGSSLGGHYASCLATRHDLRAVLINPAVIDRLELSFFLGEHRNLYSDERFFFTEEHARQLQAMTVPQTDPKRFWLLLESGDEVLDYRQALTHYRGCRQTVLSGGNHSFTQFPQFVSQIIEFAGL